MMPQHGGKYADHEFVKVASKVIKGVERAPYNKFETVLVNYDKMKEIKGKRNLTKTEQRIYDRTDKLIQKEFDAMFKKADTMLDQLDRKTTAQKGGATPGDKAPDAVDTAAVNPDAPAATSGAPAAVNPDAAAVNPDAAAVNSDAAAAVNPDAAAAVNPDPAVNPAVNPVKDSAAKEVPATGAATNAPTNAAPTNDAQNPPSNPHDDSEANDTPTPAAAAPAAAAPAAAAAAPAAAAAAPAAAQNETSYMDSNRLYRWIVSLLKGIWEWIKGLFMGAFSDKFEKLRKQFSADELFKLFGPNPEKIEKATGAFQEQAEKLQRLVATGIGGAASASIDMILNAFSMSPVFGTTILVWRMFQNMLMIMGASLSVQAASNSGATTLATIADPKLASEQKGGGKAKNNVTKRLKTDIRQLNRSLKRYMHFPHHRKGTTMSGSGAGSGYSYT
jgi:hypothetical protein